MKKDRKQDPKKQTIWAVLGLLIMLISAAAQEGGEAVFIILAVIMGVLGVFFAIRKTGEKKKQEQSLEDIASFPRRPTAPDCDYGEINCDYSHEYARKVSQLNAFLKNGIIDRAEYNVLLAKYRKVFEQHQ